MAAQIKDVAAVECQDCQLVFTVKVERAPHAEEDPKTGRITHAKLSPVLPGPGDEICPRCDSKVTTGITWTVIG